MNFDPVVLRTALIITLSILVLVMLARRMRRKAMEADLPAVQHAELLALEVEYHPTRLHVVVNLPSGQLLRTALLDQAHQVRHTWPEGRLDKGVHAFERTLPPLDDGVYFLEVSTATQRTVRQFRLQ
jgi:hypothetical protein